MSTSPISMPAPAGCGIVPVGNLDLRVGALFVIFVTSLLGTLFPIVARRNAFLRRRVHWAVYDFAKFFGSGVILSTGIIHLLEPAAVSELGLTNTIEYGGCLPNSWNEYPYAFGICLAAIFATFMLQIILLRAGTRKMDRMTLLAAAASTPSPPLEVNDLEKSISATKMEQAEVHAIDFDKSVPENEKHQASNLLSVILLEFGICFHSVIIGLTLAVASNSEFNTLFAAIVFHQVFEGLGLGARLAFLPAVDRAHKHYWILSRLPILGAFLYSAVTPFGMAIGLGARFTISIASAESSIVAGVLDAISAGILIYTSLVELIASEFIANDFYMRCSWQRFVFVIVSMGMGTGLMSLIGKWA